MYKKINSSKKKEKEYRATEKIKERESTECQLWEQENFLKTAQEKKEERNNCLKHRMTKRMN